MPWPGESAVLASADAAVEEREAAAGQPSAGRASAAGENIHTAQCHCTRNYQTGYPKAAHISL